MIRKTHKSAVVVIPPEDVWPPIQQVRLKHDRQLRRWMPHITLVYPFRPMTQFDDLARQFSAVCRSIEPFEVTLSRFGSFEHSEAHHTVWLVPEPKGDLVRLQTLLWQVVPDCNEVRSYQDGFTPHLSVGQVRGRDETTRLMDELQSAWRPVSFSVSEVCLIWRGDPPDDRFRVGCTVPLGLNDTGKT